MTCFIALFNGIWLSYVGFALPPFRKSRPSIVVIRSKSRSLREGTPLFSPLLRSVRAACYLSDACSRFYCAKSWAVSPRVQLCDQPVRKGYYAGLLTPLEPQSRFGDKLLGIWVVCPQNGAAVLKGLNYRACNSVFARININSWFAYKNAWLLQQRSSSSSSSSALVRFCNLLLCLLLLLR